jgi:KipI family sensor histidine kinase inhibitor
LQQLDAQDRGGRRIAGARGANLYRLIPKIEPAGDRAILLEWDEQISSAIHAEVARITRRLLGKADVCAVHPAYASVLVEFDPRRTGYERLEHMVRELIEVESEDVGFAARTIEIPVHYGGSDGPDLEEVARLRGLTMARVVELHSEPEYLVYFLGFSPGFPYLGGLPAELATPRLERPRRLVPAGSVAIGGEQTGVYPAASPGGWRIIGRTPVTLFTPDRAPFALLRMGDRVRFIPV